MPCKPILTATEKEAEALHFDKVFRLKYGKIKACPKCLMPTKFHRIKSYKAYVCQRCGFQISPLGGTPLAKSSTPLAKWVAAANAYWKTGGKISAMEVMRKLGVTYKTAWRMRKIIGEIYGNPGDPLWGFLFG